MQIYENFEPVTEEERRWVEKYNFKTPKEFYQKFKDKQIRLIRKIRLLDWQLLY